MAEREWVTRRRCLSEEDLSEALVCARLFPGSAAVQLVSSLGAKLGGWPGSLAATLSFLLPSVLAMLALGAVAGHITRPPALRGATGGLMAAAAGLLLGTGVRLGWRAAGGAAVGPRQGGGSNGEVGPRPSGDRGTAPGRLRPAVALTIALGAFASGTSKYGSSALTVLAAGLLGTLLLRPDGQGRGSRRET